MGAIGRARIEGGLSWEHSVPALLAAYERAFAKMGRTGSLAAADPPRAVGKPSEIGR